MNDNKTPNQTPEPRPGNQPAAPDPEETAANLLNAGPEYYKADQQQTKAEPEPEPEITLYDTTQYSRGILPKAFDTKLSLGLTATFEAWAERETGNTNFSGALKRLFWKSVLASLLDQVTKNPDEAKRSTGAFIYFELKPFPGILVVLEVECLEGQFTLYSALVDESEQLNRYLSKRAGERII